MDVEASSQMEAIQIANNTLDLKRLFGSIQTGQPTLLPGALACEFVDITEYLVEEEGDYEYTRCQWYKSDDLKPKSYHTSSDNQRLGRLHVYGQHTHHDEVYIVADHIGLIRLRDTIVRALHDQMGTQLVMTSDGEGYTLIVLRRDSQKDWERLQLPYMADWIRKCEENKTHPADLLDDTRKIR
jgi:hypothetical protein